jgi:HEPN domain-containing protein
MARLIRTRTVKRELYKNYMKKSEEFYRGMEYSFEAGDWNACVVNAVHCAISNADTMTVFYLGFRYAGEKHNDVLQLLKEIDTDSKEIQSKNRQRSSLLSIKNRAEYEERLMRKKEAENAIKAAKRYHEWVKNKIS